MRSRLLVAAAACLWGMWSLCFKSAERASSTPLSAATETFVVFAVMFVVLAPFAWRARSARTTTPSARHFVLIALLGGADAFNNLCFFEAMHHTSIAVAVLTHYLAPLLVALSAPIVLKERWRIRTFAGLALALTGLALLLQPWTLGASTSSTELLGPGLGVLSAVFFCAGVLIAKAVAPHFGTAELCAWPKGASLVVLALALPSNGLHVDTGPLAMLVGGALVFGALPLFLFYRGLTSTSASEAGVLTLCEPLVAVIVGALVWSEVPGAFGIAGGLFVLGGAFVITRGATQSAHDDASVIPAG